MEIKTLADMEAFFERKKPDHMRKFSGEFGLRRMRFFLELLGNPQEQVKVIHIAGTSGKGSTSFLISRLLQSQGLRTGLCLSPHVIDIRERFQVNTALPSEAILISYFNRMLPSIHQVDQSEFGSLTYFELAIGLAFFLFAGEGVDYAIMETGIGGLYDSTNSVMNREKIVVLTRIGRDHMETLGRRLPEIAFQKASIIHPSNRVIALSQRPSVNAGIRRIAEQNKAPVMWIRRRENFVIRDFSKSGEVFDFRLRHPDHVVKRLSLSLLGRYQAENGSLALACLFTCADRDGFSLDEAAMRMTLATAELPGRMQFFRFQGQEVVLDGAHNEQKMRGFTKELRTLLPGQKFFFIVLVKEHGLGVLDILLPIASGIAVVFLQSEHKVPFPAAKKITRFFRARQFERFSLIDRSAESLARVMTQHHGQQVVITGSFYLLAHVYQLATHQTKRPA